LAAITLDSAEASAAGTSGALAKGSLGIVGKGCNLGTAALRLAGRRAAGKASGGDKVAGGNAALSLLAMAGKRSLRAAGRGGGASSLRVKAGG